MKFNCISLFCSAGLAETYFSQHGITVTVSSELLPERADLHKKLYPDCNCVVGDINDSGVFDKIINLARQTNVDFLLATPPCQGMSTAGKMLHDDPRNRLIIPTVRAIQILKPKFAMIENVPELLQTSILIEGKWVLIKDYIENELGQEYAINERKVVNAAQYHVPQSRQRCVFLLTRKDQGVRWEFPEPSRHFMTMRDAIGNLPSVDPYIYDTDDETRNRIFPDFEKKKAAAALVSPWHCPPRHTLRHVIAMMHTPEGHSAWENQIYYPTLRDGTKSKGYKNTYKRQWWDKPAYTITKYTSRLGSQENGHPGRLITDDGTEEGRLYSEPRTMTIYELMVLSSLPRDWNIPIGTSTNLIREVIGEGVPPKLLESALTSLESLLETKK